MTTYSDIPTWRDLPDPVRQPEFYDSVPSKRLLAWVIDSVLIGLMVVLILPFTGFLALFVLFPLYFLVGFVYRIITLSRGSATWGMRLMAIELRQQNGQRFDLSTSFFHTLGYTVSFSFTILQVISVVLMVTTDRGRGLTDHLLGTVALNRRR